MQSGTHAAPTISPAPRPCTPQLSLFASCPHPCPSKAAPFIHVCVLTALSSPNARMCTHAPLPPTHIPHACAYKWGQRFCWRGGRRAPAAGAHPQRPCRSRNPTPLCLLSGLCGSHCGADRRNVRIGFLQPLIHAGTRERELRLRKRLLSATLWQQGLRAGLPALRVPLARSLQFAATGQGKQMFVVFLEHAERPNATRRAR